MDLQHALFVLPLFLVLPVAAFLLVYLYRQSGLYELPLIFLIVAATIWATGYGLELTLPTFEAKMAVVPFQYTGIVLAPLGWFFLGLQLQDQLHRLKPWMIALLLVVPVATLIQVTAQHEFYWVERSPIQYGSLLLISYVHGPGFWIHIGYSYIVQVAGGALILASVFQSTKFYMQQRVMLFLALVLPWTVNASYVFGLTDLPIDFTPLSCIISAVLIVVGVIRFRLGDLVPVARRRVIAEMRDGVMVFDDQSRLIDANQSALDLFGLPASAIGLAIETIIGDHPDIVELTTLEFDTERLYGGIPDRSLRIVAERMETGSSSCRLLVFHDLTAGTRTEAALRIVVENTSADTGHDFFRSLARSLATTLDVDHVLVGTLDADGDSVEALAFWTQGAFAEDSTYPFPGTPCEALREHRSVIYPDNLQGRFPDSNIIRQIGASAYIGTRLTNYANEMIGVLAVLKDRPIEREEVCRAVLEISGVRASAELARRQADRRLEDSEARYRRIVETTRDGVCVVTRGGLIEFLNEPMAEMIGQPKATLNGANLWAQFDPALTEVGVFSAFENSTIETQLVRRDGSRLWAAISKTLIQDQSETVSGMLVMFTDVTIPRILEEQATRMELQLQHAQKMESLGVLAGGVAHDFNNLLMPIMGYLDLIRDRSSDEVISEYVERIREAGTKLADLCDQMLTYSGKGQFTRRSVDIDERLSHLHGLVRASTTSTLQIEYPEGRKLSPIIADETQLDQIVLNLVINASEAMADTKGTISIATGEEIVSRETLTSLQNGENVEPGRYVWLEVRDEGIGIAPKDISRLFEPFYTTKFTGRGLGMAVVFGIVKAHDGAISVSSVPGGGTAIRVLFPAAESTGAGAEVNGSMRAEGRPGGGLVLVVGDEEDVRTILTRMLEAVGHDVIVAADGQEGFSIYRNHPHEIVACVIDITRSALNGYDLLQRIQSISPAQAIVLVSGLREFQLENQDVDMRHVRFLQKPFEIDDLLAALDDDRDAPVIQQ